MTLDRGRRGHRRILTQTRRLLTRSLSTPLLHPGDTFPELTLTVPGGQTVTVPEAFARYGADARKVADLTGAFVNPDPVYLQSTGFVLDPQGTVVVSVYSSGAPSAGSCPTTWRGSSATSASTPRPRPEDRDSCRPEAVSRARSG